jgi:hypothetical protein
MASDSDSDNDSEMQVQAQVQFQGWTGLTQVGANETAANSGRTDTRVAVQCTKLLTQHRRSVGDDPKNKLWPP